jgi:hypothetical protein
VGTAALARQLRLAVGLKLAPKLEQSKTPKTRRSILPRKNRDGRVAQPDRALPSRAVEKSTIPCKKQGILNPPGSQKSERKRIQTQPNWHGASYENLDRARRAWGALRVI